MKQGDTPRPVRVLLVEDSPAVHGAIASEFEADPRFEIAGQAASVAEARELLAEAEVAILDLGRPDGSGRPRTCTPRPEPSRPTRSRMLDDRDASRESGQVTILIVEA